MKVFNQQIRILHLEDLPEDAEYVALMLRKANIEFESRTIDSRDEFIKALTEFEPELIISDHSLPAFNSLEALEILRQSGRRIPFILLTGTISEDFAVKAMKAGADDYILKDRIQRLPAAIQSALEKFRVEKCGKEREQKIKESEKQYGDLIQHLPAAVYTCDADGRILLYNKAAKELWGREPQIGKELWSGSWKIYSIENKLIELEDCPMARAVKERKNIYGEEIIVERPDGSTRHVITHPSVNFNAAGEITGAVNMLIDITERKKAELELQVTNDRLSFHLENTPLGTIEWDNRMQVKSWSKRAEEIFGWTEKEFIEKGKLGFDQVYIDDQLWVFKISEKLIAGEIERNKIQHRNYTKDGRVIWCEWFNSVLKDENGKVITIMSLVQDITARKDAEEHLRKSELRLREAQAIAHTSNWEIDFVRNVQTWSDELYSIYGIGKNEVQPSTKLFLSFMHPEDADFAQKKVQEAFDTHKASSCNFRFIRKDGIIRHGYTEWRFEFDENNKPLRLYGILQDVTAAKLAEEERETMITDILQRSKSLEQFAYIVSHNLRAPIANILGLTSVISNDSQENKLIFEKIVEATTILDTTVKDIHTIVSANNPGKGPIEKLSFETKFNHVVQVLEKEISESGALITTDFSHQSEVYSVRSYLYSIMYNLVSNAIKYRLPQVPLRIHLQSTQNEKSICLSVRDNGSGIDLVKNGSKIFGLYKRFHGGSIPGKGIGLNLVKTHVESLGGRVEVESKINEGTEFRVYLPKNYGKSTTE